MEYADVHSAVDLAREEAREEALEEGRREGREEGKIIIIQRCLRRNMPVEDIIYLTGFTKEEILQLSTATGVV